MSKIEKFEDLIAWQKARELTKLIYQMTKHEKLSKDFGLTNQLQRSAVSVMANVAEGFERGNRGEFHQFLVIAKGSCAELRSLIYVALDAGYIAKQQFFLIHELTEEVGKIIGGLRSSVAKQRKRKNVMV
ncbi:MAG: four helix bundle protein [Candidatus Omnitrophica bacterium]|nr:four helix bundle protein [Candidatus Omnitrophota bacterium]